MRVGVLAIGVLKAAAEADPVGQAPVRGDLPGRDRAAGVVVGDAIPGIDFQFFDQRQIREHGDGELDIRFLHERHAVNAER